MVNNHFYTIKELIIIIIIFILLYFISLIIDIIDFKIFVKKYYFYDINIVKFSIELIRRKLKGAIKKSDYCK